MKKRIKAQCIVCDYAVHCNAENLIFEAYMESSGFNGLGVACRPLVPKFAGSNSAKAVGFLGRKNPQQAFFRRGSKAVGHMS